MKAGPLDRRIRLERATMAMDAYGQAIPTWGLLAEVWAQLVNVPTGNEARTNMEQTAEQRRVYRVRLQAAPDLQPTDRVIDDNRVWNIVDVAEQGRRDGWLISVIGRSDKTV